MLSTIFAVPIEERTIPANFNCPASKRDFESSPEARSSISIPFPKLWNTELWYSPPALSLKVNALLTPFPIYVAL